MPTNQPALDTAVTIAAFYKFARLEGLEQLRDRLLAICSKWSIAGTILLAPEGINATVSGSKTSLNELLTLLNQDERLAGIQAKFSHAAKPPFHRLKVKLKSEIVTFGVDGVNPLQRTGEHVDAERWNQLLKDPDTIVIDTRNDYEYQIGTFQSAISPQTQSFREFPQFVEQHLDPKRDRKIAMFCTGGIRCEKASAYLLEQGFERVYQLDGGILNYLQHQSREDSLWEGECFVFDGRIAVNSSLEPGKHIMCYGCRRPLSPGDCQSATYEPGVSCPHCYARLTPHQRSSFQERWRQETLARERQQKHVGGVMPNQPPTTSGQRSND